ncbi:MAG: DNA-3-methyladenine glycosylase I, partial [Spirochaetales bacterium]|nr:DNA-3-methyladenine glycosylase I [Spirochaetales bacterium]
MADMQSYCEAVRNVDETDVHRIYHDTEYGFPLTSDDALFGRLILEINQAGLSWTTILNKKEHFKRAYADFNIRRIAAFGDADRERLLSDASIIRNRLKVEAAIHNAQRVMELQREYGSFKQW